MRGGNHEGVVAHIHSDIRVGIFTVVHVDGGLGGGGSGPDGFGGGSGGGGGGI